MSIRSGDIVLWIRQRPLVSTCVVLFIALSLAGYFRTGMTDKLEAEVSSSKDALKKHERNMINSSRLNEHVTELRRINFEIQKASLKPSELARNLNYFYALESEIGVKVVDVQQQPPLQRVVPPKGAKAIYFPLVFRLTIAGDYPRVLRYLQRLETMFVIGDISNVLLTRSTNSLPGVESSAVRTATVELWALASDS